MSNFLTDVSGNLDSIKNSDNQVLTMGVDKNRVAFLKGLSSTMSGQKEDPTYTGFRIMFDFGLNGLVDPETFLPISPLLSDYGKTAGGMLTNQSMSGQDLFTASKQIIKNDINFPNYTADLLYMTAQRYLYERRSKSEDELASDYRAGERDNSGKLSAAGLKSGNRGHRYEAIVAFKNFLNNINQKSPWYFQSIEGLDNILKVNIPRQIGGNTGYKPQRSGVLTFNCLDSIDLRVNAMAELYRKATYDYQYHREALPSNLRKFRMWIIVTEIRQMVLQKQLGDILNPFNIPGVSSTVSSLSNIAQSSGILKQNPSDPSTGKIGDKSIDGVNSQLNKLEPYILMYQLDLCEFNFDDSYPFGTLYNTNASATNQVSSKFKVNVGSAKEYKVQYNILKDFINNGSAFNSLLIQDSWNLGGSIIGTDVDLSNNSNLFTKLANNFINNSVASVVQQQFSPIVTKALLGNAYGFNLSQTVRSLNSAQDLVSGIQNVKNPLGDYRPQSKGLGGPKERQYPTIKEDVLPPSYLSPNGGLAGSVYSPTNPPAGLGNIDQYPNSPGSDLGLPKRQYQSNNSDEYKNVPGKDLGVPSRVYPVINSDQYPTDPGVDLGLPSRVYQKNNIDEYKDVPGKNLGVPNRIYPVISTDEYPTNPSTDLGLPGRQYPTISKDEYPTDPGQDLGVPNRIYPSVNIDKYPTNPSPDLGLPGRQYPSNNEDEYKNVPGSDLGVPVRVYKIVNTDEYSKAPGSDLGLPGRQYPVNNQNDYGNK